jgi:hypothetical protein
MGATKKLEGDTLSLSSVGFAVDVRVPGSGFLTKRITVGSGTSSAKEVTVDWAMRVVWLTNPGHTALVPLENVTEMIP